MSSVELDDIHKTYDGDVHVIKGVDLTIADGEFLVLVGPSGCGKSTLLRMVAGLEEITSGELRIGGDVVNEVAPRDRGVGMVFQSYALYPHMTVRENMAFGLMIRKLAKDVIDRRVREASALLGLDELLDRHPKQLSGGQRQRVAMGRAIVRQPEVFLFDEPLSNLDAALRTQMRVELKKLHRRLGATMLYVTHDQVEAMTLADRITILHEGLVQQVGTPTEVYETPANEFVASFIGSPSMNFFKGSIEDGTLHGPHYTFPLPDDIRPAKVGVRPQHIQIARAHEEATPEGFGSMEGTVDVIEPMGWEAYVHLKLGEEREIIAHVEMEKLAKVQPGQDVVLHVPVDKLHFFDDDGGRISVA